MRDRSCSATSSFHWGEQWSQDSVVGTMERVSSGSFFRNTAGKKAACQLSWGTACYFFGVAICGHEARRLGAFIGVPLPNW